MKQLSIIIPHYNTPELLTILLESIPDIPEVEALVIDDNSDRGLEAFSKIREIYGKRNIYFYKNSADKKGAGNARNIGLDHAVGRWVLFADADDFFVPEFWEIISAYMDSQEEVIFFAPTSRMLKTCEMSDRHIYYEQLIKAYAENPCNKNELKLRYTYWSPCSKLIQRIVIEKNRIRFDGTIYSNDVMFSAKIGYSAKSIKAVCQVIYCITQSEKTLTASVNKHSLRVRRKVFCDYYFFIHRVLSEDDMKFLGYNRNAYIHYYFEKIKLLLHVG